MIARQLTLKSRVMAATIAVALLSAVAWSYHQLAESHASASAAGQDLVDCRTMVEHIEQLRRRPAVAGAQELGAGDLSRRIEQAARAADFAAASIERIDPQTPRRIGDTNYLEVATQVRLRHLTLQQIFTFLHAVGVDPSPQAGSGTSSALRVNSIRLSAPRGEETGSQWTVEATLVYAVYAPKGKESSGEAVAER